MLAGGEFELPVRIIVMVFNTDLVGCSVLERFNVLAGFVLLLFLDLRATPCVALAMGA